MKLQGLSTAWAVAFVQAFLYIQYANNTQKFFFFFFGELKGGVRIVCRGELYGQKYDKKVKYLT